MTATVFESDAAQAFFDPYACDVPDSSSREPAPQPEQDDYLLPPPNPAQRLDISVGPRDRRRLDLHAALTTAGVPPQLEDREAIDQLSALPDSINMTIQRWIHHTTQAWSTAY
ncbi:hypothetical protein ADK57_20510 [Streptomyces sp. MMG1533]|uniref:hypothetical protein n=1 Tax=Streptomyces sp. MMG1533 TaxID=1415546 RepID=UPI0006AEED6B|nr:hypothetical protein [Streptomyces sp. MMG1533]KOU63909.1 hypothetical protein ADK57_20510 [Streptomyces sp. MMG1533]